MSKFMRARRAIQNSQAPDKLLTMEEVMARVAMARSTLYLRLSQDRFPRPVRHGRSNLWRESAISQWIDELRPVTPTAALRSLPAVPEAH